MIADGLIILPNYSMFVQKIFTVPSTAEQKKIPFARVNHAKYMVTDRVVYIGTPLHLKWTSIILHSNINCVACFLRDIQLVRDLLYSDGWCGLSGEPDGLRGQKRPGDTAEPSTGAVPAGLDVRLCQRALHGQRGCLSSWPTLRGFCSPKAHCIVHVHYAHSFHLNFTVRHATVIEWTLDYLLLFSDLLAFLCKKFSFYILLRTFYFCTLWLTIVSHEWRCKGPRFLHFTLGRFVYIFPVPNFSNLM